MTSKFLDINNGLAKLETKHHCSILFSSRAIHILNYLWLTPEYSHNIVNAIKVNAKYKFANVSPWLAIIELFQPFLLGVKACSTNK